MVYDWWTTGALVVLAAALLWKYWTWNYTHWERLGVPHVQPSVPFGNIKDAILGRKAIGMVLADIYWKMQGQPFCGYYRLRQPALLLRDAELVRTMYVKDFAAFQDNNLHVSEDMEPLLAKHPFILKGEKWRKMRSQLTPAFTASRLKPMVSMMKEVCDDLVAYLKEESLQNNPDGLEAMKLCMRYTTDVILSCGIGFKGGALQDKKSKILEMFQEILKPTPKTIFWFMAANNFPWVNSVLRLRGIPENVITFFSHIVSDAVASRQRDGVYRKDYLHLLIELKEKGFLDSKGQLLAEKTTFTEMDIAAQVITFLVDGTQTSSAAMSFALYELALRPDLQHRLRQELRDIVDKHEGRLCYEAIQEAAYLEMVILEAMRLHPSFDRLEKICTAPYTLTTPSGRTFTLQPGTVVVAPMFGLHYDSQYFSEPNIFDPERFSPENKNRTAMQAFMPFGMGPRSCLGQRFAMWQIKMGLASILLNMEVRCTPRTPTNISQNVNSVVSAASGGLWLGFHPLTETPDAMC